MSQRRRRHLKSQSGDVEARMATINCIANVIRLRRGHLMFRTYQVPSMIPQPPHIVERRLETSRRNVASRWSLVVDG